jgi:hypothetical protein
VLKWYGHVWSIMDCMTRPSPRDSIECCDYDNISWGYLYYIWIIPAIWHAIVFMAMHPRLRSLRVAQHIRCTSFLLEIVAHWCWWLLTWLVNWADQNLSILVFRELMSSLGTGNHACYCTYWKYHRSVYFPLDRRLVPVDCSTADCSTAL